MMGEKSSIMTLDLVKIKKKNNKKLYETLSVLLSYLVLNSWSKKCDPSIITTLINAINTSITSSSSLVSLLLPSSSLLHRGLLQKRCLMLLSDSLSLLTSSLLLNICLLTSPIYPNFTLRPKLRHTLKKLTLDCSPHLPSVLLDSQVGI